jgi:cobalamin biosynthesis protein CobT
MSVIKQLKIKNSSGFSEPIDIGAKAENVLFVKKVTNENEEITSSINTNIQDTLDGVLSEIQNNEKEITNLQKNINDFSDVTTSLQEQIDSLNRNFIISFIGDEIVLTDENFNTPISLTGDNSNEESETEEESGNEEKENPEGADQKDTSESANNQTETTPNENESSSKEEIEGENNSEESNSSSGKENTEIEEGSPIAASEEDEDSEEDTSNSEDSNEEESEDEFDLNNVTEFRVQFSYAGHVQQPIIIYGTDELSRLVNFEVLSETTNAKTTLQFEISFNEERQLVLQAPRTSILSVNEDNNINFVVVDGLNNIPFTLDDVIGIY